MVHIDLVGLAAAFVHSCLFNMELDSNTVYLLKVSLFNSSFLCAVRCRKLDFVSDLAHLVAPPHESRW